jgi:hypothetical protein
MLQLLVACAVFVTASTVVFPVNAATFARGSLQNKFLVVNELPVATGITALVGTNVQVAGANAFRLYPGTARTGCFFHVNLVGGRVHFYVTPKYEPCVATVDTGALTLAGPGGATWSNTDGPLTVTHDLVPTVATWNRVNATAFTVEVAAPDAVLPAELLSVDTRLPDGTVFRDVTTLQGTPNTPACVFTFSRMRQPQLFRVLVAAPGMPDGSACTLVVPDGTLIFTIHLRASNVGSLALGTYTTLVGGTTLVTNPPL